MNKLLIMFALILSGCASSGNVVMLNETKIEGPKVVALQAPRAPWVIEIQNRLKQKGFTVLRWGTTKVVSEQVSDDKVETYNQAEARHILVIEGYANYNSMNRCFGGGYHFDHISVDLVDVKTNETLLNVNGSGYSENCPPLSGTIFQDIANAVAAAWK